MARPVKWRRVEFIPEDTYFLPCPKGNCKRFEDVDEIRLKVEELEAMRLKDIEKLTQAGCAKRMEVSRQTFQNIIDEARRKVAVALTEGKAISVGGGRYTRNICKFRCRSCGDETEASVEQKQRTCKHCGSTMISCNKKKCHTECEDLETHKD
jgi:predicted DNA-binding protein (UPF0251 family)